MPDNDWEYPCVSDIVYLLICLTIIDYSDNKIVTVKISPILNTIVITGKSYYTRILVTWK